MNRLEYPVEQKKLQQIINKRRAFTEDERINATVQEIIGKVKSEGDRAVKEYTARFDGVHLQKLTVSPAEITAAYQEVDQLFLTSLREASKRIEDFHRRQLRESWFTGKEGNMVGQLINPLERVGAYVPGGRAAYPSSVLMTTIPAQVAGVKEIAVVTPPDKEGKINPYTLVALQETGIEEIYKIGGAQAIAALAWGTETIKQVDKIVGPGNIFVTIAKKMAYGQVDIDMLAGPSEVLILADRNADPSYIAADLLSQAEHDPLVVPILVTDSKELAMRTEEELAEQLSQLSKKEIAGESLKNNGLIIITDNIEQGIKLVNQLAPEHFELLIENPFARVNMIKNAGAIFVGEYSPEPLGDYMAGPNHVLPTGGTARFASPLNTDDFIKKSSLIFYQQSGLEEVEKSIRRLANLEGLDAHAAAVARRFPRKEADGDE